MRLALLPAALLLVPAAAAAEPLALSYGPRPAYLISRLPGGALKDRLQSCAGQTPARTEFSIGHRGAPLMFPEHTAEGHRAAAAMGAGILECDVTFTGDLELVCRHAQNDLHRTTDILTSPLADRCIRPFTPAAGESPASAECRSSELTLQEFRSLRPKMDSANPLAATAQDYQGGLPSWRSTLYSGRAQTLTHAESIALFQSLGAKFMPELKAAAVPMPFNGFTQQDFAQKLIDDYKTAGIAPADVWVQSFSLDDILYWIEHEPEFGRQAVLLDGSYRQEGFDHTDPATFPYDFAALKAQGVNYLAPPLWMLVTVRDGRIVPSAYAIAAKAAGLRLITWTLERSGPLQGGEWYFQSLDGLPRDDGLSYQLLHVLAQDVGVAGVFSDWPATVTYYANCMGL
ncbi:glycerophosphodiester phosphodiesterase family protein [Leisingera methylohalidivorans]|uniref:glycerophosphodiester phosphodiesterase n=1 Tax=Leisingera methylohalidivorans DSM 14336 TaxID=999552 RepID=V9VWI5_9RHOB|nr:glycerophosphodiester phosphodiesterase family protein [Leisingera methylohalidivorans]AHD01237.1 glycerophosphoryl diester phosphodiesterase [Leisingera methylohalidivorans DSM 14336]